MPIFEEILRNLYIPYICTNGQINKVTTNTHPQREELHRNVSEQPCSILALRQLHNAESYSKGLQLQTQKAVLYKYRGSLSPKVRAQTSNMTD